MTKGTGLNNFQGLIKVEAIMAPCPCGDHRTHCLYHGLNWCSYSCWFPGYVDKEQGLFSFRSGNQVRLDTEAKKIIQMCLFSNHFSFGYLMCSTRYNIDSEFDEYPLIQVWLSRRSEDTSGYLDENCKASLFFLDYCKASLVHANLTDKWWWYDRSKRMGGRRGWAPRNSKML
jgi:hypothetical protein